jgi:hypothetical protein
MAGLNVDAILEEILSIKKNHQEVYEEYFYDLEDEIDELIELYERKKQCTNGV